jgi:PAS domain S-box-containing protein
MRLAPRTILGQLIAGSLIVQVLVFATFSAVNVRREYRQTLVRNEQRLMVQTRTLADVLDNSLEHNDAAMLDTVMESLPISSTIKAVRVTDVYGNTLRATGSLAGIGLSPAERSLLPGLLREPRYYHAGGDNGEEGIKPVIVNGAVRGIVWVTPDFGVSRRYVATALQDVLIYGGFALLGNLLLVWALSATMARPLRQLRLATMQVQKDPNDLSAFPLEVHAHNEAGELTASFNSMVNQIALQRRGTHETLSLLDSMLNSAPVGFAFYDRSLRYVRLNQHLADMHGLPIAAHIGKRYRDLLPLGASLEVADEAERMLQMVFRTGVPAREREISGTMPDGNTRRTWAANYFPVPVADGEVRWVGVIATDVTERKKAEEAMRRSEKLAAAGRLAASIAHEINNPLESITNLLYLLRSNKSLDAEAQEFAMLAQQELARVGEITQQTLRFNRSSSTPLDVSIPDVVRSVLMLHAARLRAPKIDVQLRLSDDAILFGYGGELRQLVANLVGNAIDAMPAGGHLYLRAREARRDGKRGLRITVGDTGMGMSDAVRRRIFEPFFTTKEVTGTGLGLWVSEEILTRHRGALLVRSREAQAGNNRSGTVFSIFLPADGVPRRPVLVTPISQVLADHVA